MEDFDGEIKRFFTSHDVAIKYAKITVFLSFCAIAYNLFIVPIHLVAGGSAGVGVLFNTLFGTDPSVVIFIISFAMFAMAFIFLDAEQTVITLFIAFVYPLLIKAFSGIDQIFLIDNSHVLVIVVFAAFFTGFSQGNIFKTGLNIGGLSIVSKIVYKYTKLSVTLINAFVNGIIVIIGAFAVGFHMALYAILFIIISRIISERTILGRSKNKTFKIISKCPKKIEEFIHKQLNHDVTIYNTYGA